MSDEGIKDLVKQKYGQAALRVTAIGTTSCCGDASSRSDCDPVTSNLYAQDQTAELPEKAVAASLGCGNPTALAELTAGETVLDLEAESTCCCRRSAWGRRAKRMAWT
jgi:hypothetical protein